MSNHVHEMVKTCMICRQLSPIAVEPLNPSTLPDKSWERPGADLFEFEKSHYVPPYSRLLQLVDLSQEAYLNREKTTLEVVKSILSTHGIPDQIISDNGPQFAKKEFESVLRDVGSPVSPVHLTTPRPTMKRSMQWER